MQAKPQQLALWSDNEYTYVVARLHDEEENRLKAIEAKLDEVLRRLDEDASDLHTASRGSS